MQIRSRIMWRELSQWEENNNAVAFIVVTTEEIRDALQYYNAFDKTCYGNEVNLDYICDAWDITETLVLEAIKWTYNSINFEYGINYEAINDSCYEYIVEQLSTKTNNAGLEKGNIWNSETKGFETVADFKAKFRNKFTDQQELNLQGGA